MHIDCPRCDVFWLLSWEWRNAQINQSAEALGVSVQHPNAVAATATDTDTATAPATDTFTATVAAHSYGAGHH